MLTSLDVLVSNTYVIHENYPLKYVLLHSGMQVVIGSRD
jgi:hypothetical protein